MRAVAIGLAFVASVWLSAGRIQAAGTDECVTIVGTNQVKCWASTGGVESAPGGTSGPSAPGPAVVSCSYSQPEDVARGPGFAGLAGVFVRTNADGSISLAYYKECTDGAHGWIWVSQPPPGAPGPAPGELAPGARALVEARLPTLTWHTPAEWDRDRYAYVQVPTYFWLDDTSSGDVVARASVGSVWAEATAVPDRLVIDPGDGSAPVECAGRPPAYTAGTPVQGFDGCSYLYRHSSATASNGETFEVRAHLVWHVTWRGSDGTSGDLGELTTTADPRLLAVAEVQAITTSG